MAAKGTIISLLGVACVLGCLELRPAVAQTAGQASGNQAAAENQGALSEVVVTARRREESLLNVPVAITALSGENLRQDQIFESIQLQYHVASLTTRTDPTFTDVLDYAIRGQSQELSGRQPGVVTYFAEVPFVIGYSSPFFDMDDVQVLKGPQGTLFGLNTTGGAVLLEPKKPTNDFDGYVSGAGGNLNYNEFQAALNVPVVPDKVLLRVAFDSDHRNGYIDNLSTHQLMNDIGGEFVRVGLTVTPVDWFENYFLFAWNYRNENGSTFVLTNFNPHGVAGSVFGPGLSFLFNGLTFAGAFQRQQESGPYTTYTNLPTMFDRDTRSDIINQTTIHLGDLGFLGNVDLRNIFGQQRDRGVFDKDYSMSGLPVLYVPLYFTNNETLTEEFQVKGQSVNKRLDWIVGTFLLRPFTVTPGDTEQALIQLPIAPPSVSHLLGESQERSISWYAQGTYNLSDWISGLSFTAGYRYTWDKLNSESLSTKGGTITHPTSCSVINPATGTPFSLNDCFLETSGKWSAPNWNLSLDYKPSADSLVYLASRRGFKAGGFNANAPVTSALFSYLPETLTDIELGGKADWELGGMKGRLTADVYNGWYDDIQISTTYLVNGVIGTYIQNAAKASIRGFELESSTFLTRDVEFDLIYSLINAEFTAYGTPGVESLTGGQFEDTPKDKVSATLRYTLPMDENFGRTSVYATYYWQSATAFNSQVGTEPESVIAPYSLANFGVEWSHLKDSPLDFRLFCSNCLDRLYKTGGLAILSSFGYAGSTYGPPRTYGFELRYRFGASANK